MNEQSRDLGYEWNDYVGFAMDSWRDGKRRKLDSFQISLHNATQVIPHIFNAVELALEMNDKFYSDASLTLMKASRLTTEKFDDALIEFAREYEK